MGAGSACEGETGPPLSCGCGGKARSQERAGKSACTPALLRVELLKSDTLQYLLAALALCWHAEEKCFMTGSAGLRHSRAGQAGNYDLGATGLLS